MDWPAAIFPVPNRLELALSVSVWVTESSLRTVTVAPGATVRLTGENMKFLITIVSAEVLAVADALAPATPEAPEAAGAAEELEPLLHAASRKARVTPASASHRSRRRWMGS
jgi:hypothetical protein